MKFSEFSLNGEDCTALVAEITEVLGLDELIPGRYSALLQAQLAMGYVSRTVPSHRVVDEIMALEGRRPSYTKAPTMFTGRALKGLWHKHYLASGMATFARNLRNGIQRDGLPWIEEVARQVTASGEEHYLTEEDAARIAHDAVIGNWERRTAAKQVTGEWIVYAQHEGANYYLCIADHNSGDDHIRAHIDELCLVEFPFLTDLLENP